MSQQLENQLYGTSEELESEPSDGTTDEIAEETPALEAVETAEEDAEGETEAIETEETQDTDDDGPDEDYFEIDGDQITVSEYRDMKREAGDRKEFQSDYSKKTKVVADEKKEVAAMRATVDARLSMLDSIEQDITALVAGKSLDGAQMESLLDTNPSEYLREQRRQEENANTLSQLQAKQTELRNVVHAENYQKLHTSLAWDDDAKKTKDVATVTAFAERQGVTPAEFATFTHPAIIEAFKIAEETLKQRESNPVVSKRSAKAPKSPKPSSKKSAPVIRSLADRLYS